MYPVKEMAKALQVSRSRYYTWLKSPITEHDLRDAELKNAITQIYEEHRKTYGSPRVYKELKKHTRCSRKRVARIMRENGFVGRLKRKFKVTTDSTHDFPVSPNLVNREFTVEQPNKIWVSDITYIWTMEGWLYLCIILDLFSRRAVGWSLDCHIRAELAIDALSMAVLYRNPPAGIIFHSDRGVQYASEQFREKLVLNKMVQSMSRKGNCWDNACAESFFSTLKTEEVLHRVYRTRAEARVSIFEYIAVFYNRHRSHSSLDFLTPEEYEFQSGLIPDVA